MQSALARLIERDPPDVVHAHFADAATIALNVADRRRFVVLYTPHSLALDKRRCRAAPDDDAGARLARETRAIVEADVIIVSSDDEAHHQVGAYDPSAVERCTVARPGVQLVSSSGTGLASALVEPFLHEPDRPFVLAIARPVPKKNLPMLLDAYGRSAALRQRANLVILAGQHERIRAECDEQTDELDRLHALVARHGLAGQVALPSSHAPETVTQLYRLAAHRRGLFANPARHEPFGLTLIEAARFGLPVVATRNGGPRDIVAALGHGRLVDPDRSDGIAAEAARRAGIALSIVGAVEDRYYFERRVAPWLSDDVRHVGHVEGARLAELFGRASVLLFTPLWEEPFGLVAIEAMACGLPVAYIDRGAASEVVGEGGVGAERDDAAALAAAIGRALAIPRERPRRRVEARFTLARMLDGYERLYGECGAGAAASRSNGRRPTVASASAACASGRDTSVTASAPDAEGAFP